MGPGEGVSPPLPHGTLGLVFPLLHCIPGSRREGREAPGAGFGQGSPGRWGGPRWIGAAVMVGETRGVAGLPGAVGAEQKKR